MSRFSLHPPENGVHAWIMETAWKCRRGGLSRADAEIAILATESLLRAGRRFGPGEIEGAVAKVYLVKTQGGRVKRRSIRKPRHDPEYTQQIHERIGFEPYDLWENSPLRLEGQETDFFVDELFPGNPLLCCGASQFDFDTLPREGWRSRSSTLQFIVPALMTSRTGLTEVGKKSAHSKANTGQRRYLVLDFDDPPSEQHASLCWELRKYGPLVLVLQSGGKSLHAWFRAEECELMGKFFRFALVCGADRQLWANHSQFVRMPGGLRNNGTRQTVLYFNPDNLPT